MTDPSRMKNKYTDKSYGNKHVKTEKEIVGIKEQIVETKEHLMETKDNSKSRRIF